MVILSLDLFISDDIHLHPHKQSTSMATNKLVIIWSDLNFWTYIQIYHILTTAFFQLSCFSFSDTPTISANPLNWGFQSHLFSVRTSHKQENLFQKQSNQRFGKQCFLISLGLGNIQWFSTWGALGSVCEYWDCFGLSQRLRAH